MSPYQLSTKGYDTTEIGGVLKWSYMILVNDAEWSLGTLADGIDLMACQGNMEVLFPFALGIADRDGIGIVIIAK